MAYLARLHYESDLRNKERILDVCRPLPGARLLDFGCADGTFTVELARRIGAQESHAIEFVEPLAAVASERGIQVTASNLSEPFPYADETFDVVHSNQVTEHLEKTDSFLREIVARARRAESA